MPNSYIQFPDSYNATEGNLTPYQQNIATQNQNMQQLLQQGNQLASQLLGGSINPQLLAKALRKPETSNTDFLTGNYTSPSVGINPNSTLGYNIDSYNGFGIR